MKIFYKIILVHVCLISFNFTASSVSKPNLYLTPPYGMLYSGVNIPDQWGNLPLQNATIFNHFELIKDFTNKGADVNGVTDRNEETPLHLALTNIHKKGSKNKNKIFAYLLQQGADPTICNKDQQSLLHKAVQYQDIFAIQKLIEMQIDLNAKNSLSQTPLDLARKGANSTLAPKYRKKYYEMCRILQEVGAYSTILLQPMPSDETMHEEYQKETWRLYNIEEMTSGYGNY